MYMCISIKVLVGHIVVTWVVNVTAVSEDISVTKNEDVFGMLKDRLKQAKILLTQDTNIDENESMSSLRNRRVCM